MLDIQDDISSYLAFSHYIDWNEPSVQRKAKELKDSTEGEIELAKAAYYFVRDEIKHSWDVQDKRVTATASDALREGVGICWAKSNLLAALLRANGIPAGICYQRLTLGSTPESGYCIHALNAIYLRSIDRWIRVEGIKRVYKQTFLLTMNVWLSPFGKSTMRWIIKLCMPNRCRRQ